MSVRFRKGFITRHFLLAMIEKLRKSLDSGGRKDLGASLTDLSKAFDYLPQDLLIAKPHIHGIKKGSLNFCSPTLKIENKEFV